MISIVIRTFRLSIVATIIVVSLAIYKYSKDPIPSKPLTNNRTAVCITGQLRSGNLTWDSGKLRNNQALRMFGSDDPPTPIETTLEWFLKPLALYGGIDVFMYVQAHPESKAESWNGDPNTYEPVINDTFVCSPYIHHPIFQNHTGNRFFCLVEPEVELMSPFINEFHIWHNYSYGSQPRLREQVLQQLYGMYRANLAAKQHAIANFIDYTYKVRLRPDTAFIRPLIFEFLTQFSSCNHTIWCPNHVLYGNGWEDSFNFGYTSDMDKLLDRYQDLISLRYDVPLVKKGSYWDLEDHLSTLLRSQYDICLFSSSYLWIVVIRKQQWGLNTWIPPSNTIQWRQINK